MTWKRDKLGNHLTTLTDYHANGSYKKLKANVTLLGEPDYAVMIRTTNFERNDFENDLKYINEHAYNFLAKSKVYPKDILMNKIANAGSVYLMPDLGRPVSLAMNLFLLRTNPETTDQVFIYYFLKCNEEYIKLFAIGAAANTITKENVRNLEIKLPNLPTQQKIATILSTYDNLIENNTRRIKILEEMAQTIYKEWFVNFRFPGYEKVKFVDSPLGKTPEGWESSKLGELISFVKGKKPKIEYNEQINGSVNLLLLDNIASGNYQYTDYEERICITANDIVMVMDGASSGKVIIGLNGFLGSTLATLKISDESKSVYRIYYFLQDNYKNISDNNTGAAIPHASKEYIVQLDFVKPSQIMEDHFYELASSFHNEISLLKIKNNNLRKTRDLLLPKLMSGEVEV